MKARARAAVETWSTRLSADTGCTRKRTRTPTTGTSRKVGSVPDPLTAARNEISRLREALVRIDALLSVFMPPTETARDTARNALKVHPDV